MDDEITGQLKSMNVSQSWMFDRLFVQKSCKKPNLVNFLEYIA